MKNKHNHISFIALFFLMQLFLSSCYLLEPPGGNNSDSAAADQNAVAATVIIRHFDGCSWMLALESGKNLEPVGIPAEFLKEGLKVWVKYIPREGMSICMAGQMVTVTEIKIRE